MHSRQPCLLFFPACSISRDAALWRPCRGLKPMPNTRKILIVDDDAELRDALVEQLSLHEEFEAVAVDTGTKGVQAAKAGQIDLVIMDVGLPDIDGREAVRILRKNGFKAPIIMLTGHDTDSDTILGLESGANDYVTKPFRFAVLLARIRAQLAPARGERGRGLHHRALHVPAELEAPDQPEGQQGPPDREGDRDPALSLSRRPAAGVARDAAAGGLGLQFGRHHAHARDAHLPAAAEGREGRRRSRRSWSPRRAATSWCREHDPESGTGFRTRSCSNKTAHDHRGRHRVPRAGADLCAARPRGAAHSGDRRRKAATCTPARCCSTPAMPADGGYVVQEGSFRLRPNQGERTAR